MKTLLYLASGSYLDLDRYRQLPYEIIILVDRELENRILFKGEDGLNIQILHWNPYPLGHQNWVDFLAEGLPLVGNLPDGVSKIILEMGMDAIPALACLIKLKIKIDALVSINEGLWAGGGDYIIFSDLIMGLALPLFRENVTLVCDPSYYFHKRKLRKYFKKFSIWGCSKTEINNGEPDYLSPARFNQENPNMQMGKVYRLHKRRSVQRYENYIVEVKLILDSIWGDFDKLNLMVFPMNALNVFHYNGRSARDVLSAVFVHQARCQLNEWNGLAHMQRDLGWYQNNGVRGKKYVLGIVSHSFLKDPDEISNMINFLDVNQIEIEIRFYCLTDIQFWQGLNVLNQVII